MSDKSIQLNEMPKIFDKYINQTLTETLSAI